MRHLGPGNARSQAECFQGSEDAVSWEMCDFRMGMDSCFYPMAFKKHQGSRVEITHVCTPLFCMNCVLVMGYRQIIC